MDINVVNFVIYFVGYLFVGFVFFYFTLFKKKGSNLVGTVCLVIVFGSLAGGFVSAVHLGILNVFILVLAFWFAYLIMKMYRQDKLEEERMRKLNEKRYHQRLQRKQMESSKE